ncbi:MAG: superoxide dismutase [Microscillaceae bacterium]
MKKREFLKANALLAGSLVLNPFSVWAENRPTRTTNEFTLPPLDYDFEALEPAIDTLTMQIHHGKHHAGYVNNLNKALTGTNLGGKSLEEILAQISVQDTALRNNAGGHYNHSLFWKIIGPKLDRPVPKPLHKAIETQFDSQEKLIEEMKTAGMKVFGSGWVWLALGRDQKLFVSATPNQDNPLMHNIVSPVGIPILGIDVWEHAYYLKYQNRRADYLNALWPLIQWEEVNRRYKAALG